MKKICFVSSSGGHWEELMCLKPITDNYNSFFVTEEGGQAQDSSIPLIYTLPQINRHEKYFCIHFLKIFFKARMILKKERPNVIITTGALVSFPFCVLSKLYDCKLIYIESFARVKDASLTGKLAYKLADLFLVQWETLLDIYPNAKYVGGIF